MDWGVVHIAGLDVQVGPYLRQRCSWCGAVLIDVDLRNVNFQISEDDPNPKYATWEVGKLVCVDENVKYIVEHEDGAKLPPQACAMLDPSVTV